MFSTWTIARKISGVVAVGLVSLLAIGVLAYSTTAELLRNAGMVTHTHQVLEANDSILSLLKDAETGQRGYLITGEHRYLEPYNNSKNSIHTTIQRIKQLTSDTPDQQARLGELERLIEGKFKELQETIDLRKTSGFDAARAVVLTDQGKRVMDGIRRKLSEVDQNERVLLQQRSEEARSSADTTQAVILWGTLACLGLSGTLAFVVIRGVSRILLLSVSELASGANQLAGAAAHVAAASQALAQGSSEQAASIEETSASSEEVNSMARRNSESSRSAADLVQASQQKFTETSHSLQQMVAAMDEIKASSGRISTIIKTIDEIAFQTNILALNAAVEAARAGEAGMGFAVVAEEVRNLAQRCAQAARDTSALIEESIARSSDGKTKVDQVAEAIRAVTQAAAEVKTLVEDVHVGSEEQARGIEQVSRAIAEMERVTQNTAESAEESASAAEELTAQSEMLREVVDRLSSLVGRAGRTGHQSQSSTVNAVESPGPTAWRSRQAAT